MTNTKKNQGLPRKLKVLCETWTRPRFWSGVSVLSGISTALLILQACANHGNGTAVPNPYDEKASVGAASAKILAQGSSADKLVVEIQAVKGFSPNQKSLDRFSTFVKNLLNKDVQIVTDPEITSPAATGQTNYSHNQLHQIEDQNRNILSRPGQVSIYYLFLDLPSKDDSGTGATTKEFFAHSFRNTSVAVYEPSIQNSLTKTVPALAIDVLEGSVMAHEFGHLMGLVGLTRPAINKSHADGTGHCTNVCLMGPDLLSTLEKTGLTDIPALDDDCLEDLGLKPAAKTSTLPTGQNVDLPETQTSTVIE